MGFDLSAFLNERFEDRVVDVPVPDLKAWFADGSEPVWKVRGLTGDELGRVNEAMEKYRNVSALITGIVGADPRQKAEAVKEALGIAGRKTPESVVRELELLVAGSVDPVCDMSLAVKLKDNFPIEFRQISQAILIATGKGRVPGKSIASGETPGSGPAFPSVTSEADSSMSADQISSLAAG